MSNYSQNNRSDRRDNRGPRTNQNKFSDRSFNSSQKPISFKTVCDDCGRSCTVPFKPSGNKPVYCSNCYEKHGNGEDNSNRQDNRRFNQNSSSDRQMFSAVCDNCGKKCEVPFKPSKDKPIYCSDCFENSSNSKTNTKNDFKEELKEINDKLDLILQSLKSTTDKPKTIRIKK